MRLIHARQHDQCGGSAYRYSFALGFRQELHSLKHMAVMVGSTVDQFTISYHRSDQSQHYIPICHIDNNSDDDQDAAPSIIQSRWLTQCSSGTWTFHKEVGKMVSSLRVNKNTCKFISSVMLPLCSNTRYPFRSAQSSNVMRIDNGYEGQARENACQHALQRP